MCSRKTRGANHVSVAPLARVERAEWRRPKSARGGGHSSTGWRESHPFGHNTSLRIDAARCTEPVDDEDPMRLTDSAEKRVEPLDWDRDFLREPDAASLTVGEPELRLD